MHQGRLTIALMTGALLGATGTAVAGSVLGSALFRDVPALSPYDGAIGTMVNAKVLEGFDDGTFHPDEYVTRGQLALALDRLLLSVRKNTPPKATREGRGKRIPQRKAAATPPQASATPSAPEQGVGAFRFATTGFSIIEKAKSITVSIQRVNGGRGIASVGYAVEDTTTTHGIDYVDTAGTLTFNNGETAKIVQIPLKDDAAGEGPEQLQIKLMNPVGAPLGSPSTMTVTILDDEAANGMAVLSSSSSVTTTASSSSSAPTVNDGTSITFGALQYSTNESNGAATVTVVRSGGAGGQSTIEYATTNGTAVAGSAYTATKGTLTFVAGETQKTFLIPIINNMVIDGMKTVNLSLMHPVGASVGPIPSAPLSIVDDEIEPYGIGAFKFQKKMERVSEAAGELSLTILRVGGSKGTATVDYATKSGLALGGSDYTETTGTISFLEGEAGKIIRIPITQDTNILEEDETFSVSLSNATGGAGLTDPQTATMTIAP